MRKPEIDTTSDTWKIVSAKAIERIDALRQMNDSPKADLVYTNFIRGQIDAWKSILALPDKNGNPDYGDSDYY